MSQQTFALITGASKGIGREMAIQLAAKGYNIIAVARNETLLQELCIFIQQQYQVKAIPFALDVSNTNAATTLFTFIQQQQLTTQIIINNAGYGLSGHLQQQTADALLNMMQVNMHMPVQFNQLIIPYFLQQSFKCYIVNIASTAAYQAVPGLTVYAATKAFINNYSRGLAYELRKTNISVTSISPGPTDTDFANRAQVGKKALATAEKVNMPANKVAEIAINAMFAHKKEVITGWLNKLTTVAVKILPKAISEKMAGDIYGI